LFPGTCAFMSPCFRSQRPVYENLQTSIFVAKNTALISVLLQHRVVFRRAYKPLKLTGGLHGRLV
jgi:hypothetical protein